jgi:AcrR family transcriptional regulator
VRTSNIKPEINNKLPKSKAQFERSRQRSIATIKRTALELFAQRGYHHTSVQDIADAAHISKGLLYNYFENKEALLMEIMMDAFAIARQLHDEALAHDDDPCEQLRYLTEHSIGWIKSNMQYWRLLISLSFQAETIQPLLPKIHEIEMEITAKCADIFRRIEVENPEDEAMFYGAVMDGIAIQYVQIGERYPIDKMVGMVLARYDTSRKSEAGSSNLQKEDRK